MINKQKLWFLTLFSLILVLSIYYITMPSDILMASKQTTSKNKVEKAEETTEDTSITEADVLTVLQVEKDEERLALAAEYNEVLTNKDSSTEEKNNAYNGLKELDDIKAKEETIKKKIKEDLKLDSFIKVQTNNVDVTIKKKEHDYSLANDVMRLVQEQFKEKVYVSVKFKN